MRIKNILHCYVGTYDPPPVIGPMAESVLKGCLEHDVAERWTIAMVDNVAWGIGDGNVGVDPVICEEQQAQVPMCIYASYNTQHIHTYIQLQISHSIPTIMQTQVINYVIQKSNQSCLHNPHITIP
jgi:hypothetical protein